MKFCPGIPNICPKVVNSVVNSDFWAFEVPLSDIRPLYNPCNPNRTKSKLKIFLGVPTVIAYMIKKELDVYLRVPGSSDQKTDLLAFG